MLLVEEAHRLSFIVMQLPRQLCKLVSRVADVLWLEEAVPVSCTSCNPLFCLLDMLAHDLLCAVACKQLDTHPVLDVVGQTSCMQMFDTLLWKCTAMRKIAGCICMF